MTADEMPNLESALRLAIHALDDRRERISKLQREAELIDCIEATVALERVYDDTAKAAETLHEFLRHVRRSRGRVEEAEEIPY
jgi:hypothetical protein